MSDLKLVLLGTGNPNPDPERAGPSSAVIYDGRAYIVDSGAGVVRRCHKAYLKGIPELRADRLTRLLLTHLHSDHTIGLPDLILTPWVMERSEKLMILGPPGTESMCGNILNAYREDIQVRKTGLEMANNTGIEVDVREIGPGLIIEDGDLKIYAFGTKHGSWEHSFGFRFETPERTIVISGDCIPGPELSRNYENTDILLHEAYSSSGFERLSDKWKRYHKGAHTAGKEVARLARESHPGLLVLYHTLLWDSSEEDLLEEVKGEYEGEVIIGRDLQIF